MNNYDEVYVYDGEVKSLTIILIYKNKFGF